MMKARSIFSILLTFPVAFVLAGCGSGRGAGDAPDARPDAAQGAGEGTAIARNISDVSIVVEEAHTVEGLGYVLKGRIVISSPVGSPTEMAETGQTLSLTPLFPGGRPDPLNPAHLRMMALSKAAPESIVRCRIGLDSNGGWRIISAE
jgi:predicted small secreted protein